MMIIIAKTNRNRASNTHTATHRCRHTERNTYTYRQTDRKSWYNHVCDIIL